MTLVGDSSLEERKKFVLMGKCRLRYWINKSYHSDEVKVFVLKVGNGFDY